MPFNSIFYSQIVDEKIQLNTYVAPRTHQNNTIIPISIIYSTRFPRNEKDIITKVIHRATIGSILFKCFHIKFCMVAVCARQLLSSYENLMLYHLNRMVPD